MVRGGRRPGPCRQLRAPGGATSGVGARGLPVSYDDSRGIAQLSSDGSIVAPHHLPEFQYTMGATVIVPEQAWQTTLSSMTRSDGTLCWKVDRLQITLKVHTEVRIAREIPKGSCLWNETMQHENKHVKIDQKMFPRLADTIRPQILRKVARAYPAQNQAQAERDAAKLVRTTMDAAIDSFMRKRNKAQLAIDTAAEYDRISHACGNAEVAAAVNRAGLK